ncbi:hypothetical protein AZE42_11688, partial [Rhizopogon vesiculosus]
WDSSAIRKGHIIATKFPSCVSAGQSTEFCRVCCLDLRLRISGLAQQLAA